ncbi:MAG: hypothetical protein KBD64_04840 [Gammaproteobacteria bacterium]|nr:hypothetical protein [Gammaproteobacteria bacterium]
MSFQFISYLTAFATSVSLSGGIIAGIIEGAKKYFKFGYAPVKNVSIPRILYRHQNNNLFVLGTILASPAVILGLLARAASDIGFGVKDGVVSALMDYLPAERSEIIYTKIDAALFSPVHKILLPGEDFKNKLLKLKYFSPVKTVSMTSSWLVGNLAGQFTTVCVFGVYGIYAGGRAMYNFSDLGFPLNKILKLKPYKRKLLAPALITYSCGAVFGGSVSLISKPIHSKENAKDTVIYLRSGLVYILDAIKKLLRFTPKRITTSDKVILSPTEVVCLTSMLPRLESTSMRIAETDGERLGAEISAVSSTGSSTGSEGFRHRRV